MTISYRAINPDSDYPRLVELVNAVFGEPRTTVENLRARDARYPPDYAFQHMVAVDEAGRIQGSCRVEQPTWRPTGNFQVSVLVDSTYSKRGIGTPLYNGALRFAIDHKARRLFCEVRDNLPESLAFAKERGFRLDRHIFESILDVGGFDETPLAGTIEAVEATGIRFTTLAEVGDTPENRRRVYDLFCSAMADVPGDLNPEPPFGEFQRVLYEEPNCILDGTILAVDGDEWIGFTALAPNKPQTFNHYMTGVNRRYRGHKIALAVKLLAVRCARRHGIAQLLVDNDEANAPMLAINIKMGYRRLPGWYILFKPLDSQA